jgi:hypothetical protein
MGSPTWHAKVPSKEEYLNALLELGDESNSWCVRRTAKSFCRK